MDDWIQAELEFGEFPDKRIRTRCGKLLSDMASQIGHPIPSACQDWAATKAAYRLLDNPRVSEHTILSGHFAATQSRVQQCAGPILVLHDTTEFSFKREDADAVGKTRSLPTGISGQSRTACGVLMHSSLAITRDGVPLGLTAAKFWTRKKFKGTNALKRSVNPTRIPIESKESFRWIQNIRESEERIVSPGKCVHIADREGDIFELFSESRRLGTNFLVRVCNDRICGDRRTTIFKTVQRQKVKGRHVVEVENRKGEKVKATLEVRYERLEVRPPLGKEKRYEPLWLTVIVAKEKNAPVGRDRIEWKLMTDLPIECVGDAIEKLKWYAMRWKIETFHKVLKSGCKVENSLLRTASRLTNFSAMCCVVGWRVFWLTMTNRDAKPQRPDVVFVDEEREVLAATAEMRGVKLRTLQDHLREVARLGGYLARSKDPQPGTCVIWRGMIRLQSLADGYALAMKRCG